MAPRTNLSVLVPQAQNPLSLSGTGSRERQQQFLSGSAIHTPKSSLKNSLTNFWSIGRQAQIISGSSFWASSLIFMHPPQAGTFVGSLS